MSDNLLPKKNYFDQPKTLDLRNFNAFQTREKKKYFRKKLLAGFLIFFSDCRRVVRSQNKPGAGKNFHERGLFFRTRIALAALG